VEEEGGEQTNRDCRAWQELRREREGAIVRQKVEASPVHGESTMKGIPRRQAEGKAVVVIP